MTAEDLVNTAKKYLDVNKASVTIIHPKTATSESINQNYNNISFTGSEKKEAINMSNIKEYSLQNNYRTVTINSKTNNVNIDFNIFTDNTYKGKPSAVLVLNNILNEGSMLRNQETFDTDMAKNGISTACDAENKSISMTLSCASDDMPKALEGLKEVIENPRFTTEEFAHAKNQIKESILTSQKSAYDKLDIEMYKGLPEGYSKEEILQDLDSLTIDDVKAQYNHIINNGKGEIAVSAPFDKKPELKNTLFKSLGEFKPVKDFAPSIPEDTYNPISSTKVLTDTDFKNQAEIIEAFKFRVNQNIKDKVTLSLLNTILGGNPSSRLFMDLREKEKLAYHVKSNFETNNNIGVFTLKIGTTTDNNETGEKSYENIQKSIEGFNRHIETIKTKKVTDEELNNAKLSLKNSILNSTHSPEGKTSNILNGLESPYGINRTNKLFDEIDKITTEDIYNAANYIFAGKPIYSIIATENSLKANKDFLSSLEK